MPHAVVIILNYNGRHLLDDCLQSLARLTTPVDIVVADNGSSDGSVEHLRAHWPTVRGLAFERNLGFAGGYNRALAQAECEWAVLLNNDAALAPNWLEILLAAAQGHPRAAILGGKLLFSGGRVPGRVIQCAGASYTDAGTAFEIGWGQADQGQYDQARAVASIPGAAMLIRRSVFLELGGFDADYFAYLEDVDLCWRAWLAGYEVWYIPAAEARHHFGASGGGRTSPFRIRQMQRNRYANMLKHFEPGTLLSGLITSAAYDAYRVLEFSARGQWDGLRALALGNVDVCRNLSKVLAERQMVQRRRKRRDRELRALGLLVPALTALREYRRLTRLALSQDASLMRD
jgi:hypothetical protein